MKLILPNESIVLTFHSEGLFNVDEENNALGVVNRLLLLGSGPNNITGIV